MQNAAAGMLAGASGLEHINLISPEHQWIPIPFQSAGYDLYRLI